MTGKQQNITWGKNVPAPLFVSTGIPGLLTAISELFGEKWEFYLIGHKVSSSEGL